MPGDEPVLKIRVDGIVLRVIDVLTQSIREAEPVGGLTHSCHIRIGHLLREIILVDAVHQSELENKRGFCILFICIRI